MAQPIAIQAGTRLGPYEITGAVLYEMATGRRAFQGGSKTSVIAAIVSQQPEPISSVVPMSPPALDHVVRRCLEKNPDPIAPFLLLFRSEGFS